jgi:hypothetical protein
MEAPIGYVALPEAVDIVGRKLAGSNWHSFADETSRDNLVWFDQGILSDAIRMIAEGCESGRIAAAYRRWDTGADALDPAVWRMASWRNYFATGTIDLELPLIDEKGRPAPDGRTAPQCTREILVRRDTLDHFIANLTPAISTSRYPGDAVLLEEGRRMVAGGMEKRAVARKLAPRAEGVGTFESKLDRLRKAL